MYVCYVWRLLLRVFVLFFMFNIEYVTIGYINMVNFSLLYIIYN